MAAAAPPAPLDWEAIAATGYTSLVYGLPVLVAPPLTALWNRRGRGQLQWWQLALGSYLTAGAVLGYLLAQRRHGTAPLEEAVGQRGPCAKTTRSSRSDAQLEIKDTRIRGN